MSTTTNLGIQKLDAGVRQPEIVINAALDTLDGLIGNVPRARVYHNANQSIGNAAAATLNFNSERYDSHVQHDTSTNNERLTCKTAGRYRITAHAAWAANATGARQIFIRLNGTTLIAGQSGASTGGSIGTETSISTTYDLALNDYVEVRVYQDSGGSLNVTSSGNYSPEFMMERIG